MEPRDIISRVYRHLYELGRHITFPDELTHWDRMTTGSLGVQRTNRPIRRGKWLIWNKPPTGLYKLNTDGSKKGESTAGGGVLKDNNGDIIYGFCHRYSHKEIVHAELQAILDGLIYLQAMEIKNAILETS